MPSMNRKKWRVAFFICIVLGAVLGVIALTLNFKWDWICAVIAGILVFIGVPFCGLKGKITAVPIGISTHEELIEEFECKKRRRYIFERKVALSLVAIMAVAVIAGIALQNYDIVAEDKRPPIISGMMVSDVTDNSATVTWVTDEETIGRVSYSGYSANSKSGLSRSHRAILIGLVSNRTYRFTVWSTDSSGNRAKLEGGSFTTAPIAA